jgi:hypothetical protein
VQHDNARHHAARHTLKAIQDLQLEVLPQLQYSPNFLSPSNFNLLWPIKDVPLGRNFRPDEEVKQAVHVLLARRPKYFFRGIYV